MRKIGEWKCRRPAFISALMALGVFLTLAGCRAADAKAGGAAVAEEHAANAGGRGERLIILAIDRSGSRSKPELEGDQRLVQKLIDSLGYGDRVAVLDVCASDRSEKCRPQVVRMPQPRNPRHLTRRDSVDLADAKAALKRHLHHLIAKKEPVPGTNLFATLRNADDVVQGSPVQTVLILLSDMLQAAEGVNMERAGGVPDSTWIATAVTQGRLPLLSGTCVSAVGVTDPGTANGRTVMAFWQQYFTIADARFSRDRFRRYVEEVGPLLCDKG